MLRMTERAMTNVPGQIIESRSNLGMGMVRTDDGGEVRLARSRSQPLDAFDTRCPGTRVTCAIEAHPGPLLAVTVTRQQPLGVRHLTDRCVVGGALAAPSQKGHR